MQDDGFARPHDRLFRYTFERPEVAEGELRCVLPREVVEALDFTSLTLEPGSMVDAEQGELETDLRYRVKLSGEACARWCAALGKRWRRAS